MALFWESKAERYRTEQDESLKAAREKNYSEVRQATERLDALNPKWKLVELYFYEGFDPHEEALMSLRMKGESDDNISSSLQIITSKKSGPSGELNITRREVSMGIYQTVPNEGEVYIYSLSTDTRNETGAFLFDYILDHGRPFILERQNQARKERQDKKDKEQKSRELRDKFFGK